jgi:RNA polymerase sigma-70 factor (ECF subfamily)
MMAMDSQEQSKALVERAQQGERGAFGLLVERYRARIEALIQSRFGGHLRERASVDDLFQESLLEAFRSIGRFSWKGEDSFMRWFGTIAENVVRRESRRHEQDRKIRLEPRATEQVSPSKAMRREERFDRLEDALERLSADHRQVIKLSRIDGLPVKEIARRMNRSESAVKNLLLRALKALQQSFGNTESMGLPRRTFREEGS